MKSLTRVANIVVPTDFSLPSFSAFTLAKDVAEKYGAKIHLLHVKDDEPPFFSDNSKPESDEQIMHKLRSTSLELKNGFDGEVECVLRAGTDYQAIIDYSKEIDAELIVIATHGRTGVLDTLLGGVAQKIIKYSKRPVLVTSPEENINL